MSDTTILEGPDGRLYEIPNDRLAEFAVPGERVAALRKQMASAAAVSVSAAVGSDSLPPGHSALPPGHAAMPPTSMSINPGGGVVLNFYFQTPPSGVPGTPGGDEHVHSGDDGGVQGYHMSFDESGIPVNHSDMLWGDYIDKQGNPAVGWHSHDPVTGNAQ